MMLWHNIRPVNITLLSFFLCKQRFALREGREGKSENLNINVVHLFWSYLWASERLISRVMRYFYWTNREYYQMTDWLTVEWKTVSDVYWLKTPPAPSFAPGVRSTVSHLNGARARQALAEIWSDIGPLPCCWLQLGRSREGTLEKKNRP